MNQQRFVDNFNATLKNDIAVGAVSATLLPAGVGAKLPALANGDYVRLTVTQPGGNETSWAYLRVTAVNGDTLTIDATTTAWSAGSVVRLGVPADVVDSLVAKSTPATDTADGYMSAADHMVLTGLNTLKGAGFNLNKNRAVYAGVTQSTFTAGLTAVRTTYGKCEVDAIPTRARLCIRSRVGDFNLAHWDYAIAMTEVFTDASDTEKYSPIVGGVEYNSAPPAGYQYGWLSGNMASGATGTLHEQTSDAQKLTVAVGPWVNLPFVPRADGKKGAVVLFRAVHNNTGTNFSIKGSNISAGATSADYKSRKFWTRASANGVNGITSFTSIPTATDDNGAADIYLEFEFATPVRSVWVVGDSISANFEYTGWAMQAIWGASTNDRPLIPFLHALSGSAMSSYMDTLLNYASITGSVPTDLIIPCFSPNSTHSSDASMLADQATLTTVLAWAKANGVRVFLWNGCPNNGYTMVHQARLDAMRAWAKAQVAAGNAYKFFEMSRAVTSNYGNGTVAETYTTGLNGDSTHPNQTGASRMAPLAAAALMMN